MASHPHGEGHGTVGEIVPYASRTGGPNARALRAAGWRLMVSAYGVWRDEGCRYAIDNGAWSAHTQGIEWDAGRFTELVARMGGAADFVVVPDIVAGGLASLRSTEEWLPRLSGLRLVAVQDGMSPADVRPALGDDVGIFLGGSTEWKLATMRDWGEQAHEAGCYYHVGRVNTQRRIARCVEAGADSFDGSGPSRFNKTLRRLDMARRQGGFTW